MDYVTLKSEVLSDPLGIGYGQFLPNCPGHVVELLNKTTTTMPKARMVTARTVLAEVQNAGVILDKLETLSTQIPAVKWAVKFLQQDLGIDIGHPVTRAMLDTLSDSSYGTAALSIVEIQQLKSMALQACSRAEYLGLGRITEHDLIIAGVV